VCAPVNNKNSARIPSRNPLKTVYVHFIELALYLHSLNTFEKQCSHIGTHTHTDTMTTPHAFLEQFTQYFTEKKR